MKVRVEIVDGDGEEEILVRTKESEAWLVDQILRLVRGWGC